MSKLAVFFPGSGYHSDKPLLYHSRKIAALCGYEMMLLPYSGFPQNVKGDRAKMRECFELALQQSRQMLTAIAFNEYSELLFVGKSIGTVAAAAIAEEIPAGPELRMLLYTPLEETFSYPVRNALIFTGDADPWTGKRRIPELCRERGIPCCVIPGANHSLETDDPMEDLRNLKRIMKKSLQFIS